MLQALSNHPGHLENATPITRMWSFETSLRSLGSYASGSGAPRAAPCALRDPKC